MSSSTLEGPDASTASSRAGAPRASIDDVSPVPTLDGQGPRADVVVMKFGSSVFSTERDVWSIVSEIDRHVRAGRKVVAVVSALLGHTDRLLAQARKITDSPSGPAVAALLATGEQASAALLSLALAQVGIAHAHLDARSVRLRASGPHNDASPISVDRAAFDRAFERVGVVVFPGFEAINEYNEPVVLGRGGSDLTAVFVAANIGAEVRLIKDVDGVFERDPISAPQGGEPRRYDAIRWEQVPAIASKLVQTRAVLYAAERGLSIRVCSLGSDGGTLVGATTSLGERYQRRRRLELDRIPLPPGALV